MTPVRVVLADDVEDIRYLFRFLLESDGRFEVVGEAENGREAIELARRLQPDVVLLDLAMPEMGGLDALPLIRDVSPTSKVVVATAFGELSQRAAYEHGATAFVTKDAGPGQLFDAVANAAGGDERVDKPTLAYRRKMKSAPEAGHPSFVRMIEGA